VLNEEGPGVEALVRLLEVGFGPCAAREGGRKDEKGEGRERKGGKDGQVMYNPSLVVLVSSGWMSTGIYGE
jgi:hypothetical protein